jgi:hypothetical protein
MRDLDIEYTADFIHTVNPRTEVMGRWETPLMQQHSNLCAHNHGDVLEIGFGLGISADQIQSIGVNSHTIVEIHPVIAQKARDWAANKTNVTIIEGDWYDLRSTIIQNQYDGIFFDPHMDPNRRKFRTEVVDLCIKPGGIFTWFKYEELDYFNYGNVNVIDLDINSGWDTRMVEYNSHVQVPYVYY